MTTTFVRPKQVDTKETADWDDTLAAGATLESAPTDLDDVINSIISQIQNVTGATKWYTAVTRTVETLDTDLSDLEDKKILCYANVLTDISVPSSQNWVELGGGEVPSEVVAFGTSTNGALCAELGVAELGTHQMYEHGGTGTGPDELHPRNLLEIRDSSTGQKIQSGGRDAYGLLQVKNGATDGAAWTTGGGTNDGQISFVRPDAGFDDLEACPVADIENKSINYNYIFRTTLDLLQEDCNLSTRNFVDQTATVDVTLDQAMDNQYGTIATQTDDIDISQTTGDHWEWEEAGTNASFARIETITQGAGGSVKVTLGTASVTTSEVEINGSDYDNNATTVDFLNGMTIDSGSTGIEVGLTAGQVNRAAALDIRATGDTLTLQTVTSGQLNVTSADAVAITAGTADGVTVTTGAGSSSAGGELDLTTGIGSAGFAGGTLDINTGNGGAGGSGSDGGDGGDVTVDAGVGGAAAEGATPDAGGMGGSLAFLAGAGGAGDGTDSGGSLGGDAGLGGNVSLTAGAGGAGQAGTVDPAQPAAGGDASMTGGAGGAGAGTSDNADGGDVVLSGGAPGVGGSGAAGTRGTVRLVSGGDHTHEIVQLENTVQTVQLFAGTVEPQAGAVDGLAGSIYMRDTGSGGEVYVNTSTTSGTTWTKLDAAGVTSADRQDVYDNQGATIVTTTVNHTLDIGQDNTWELGDSASAALLTVTSDSDDSVAGSIIAFGSAVDSFTSDAAAFSIDGTLASNVSVTGNDLSVTTLTSGDLILNSVDAVDMDSGTSIAITAGTGLDIDAGTTVDVNAGTASDASTYSTTITGGVSSGAGNDAPNVSIVGGTPGAGGAATPVAISTPASANVDAEDAVLTILNSGGGTGGGHGFRVFSMDQAADPTHSAPSGSLAVVVNAATTPELWLNDTSGTGSGGDWVRLATLDDVATSDTLKEVVDNQIAADPTWTQAAGDLSWGIPDSSSMRFSDSGDTGILTVAAAAAGDSVTVDLAETATGATFDVTDGTNSLLLITADTGGDLAVFDNLSNFSATADSVDITSGSTDIDLTAGTSIDIAAGTEVTILSGGSSDVDITAGRDIDMAGECLRFDAPVDYGHHQWATEYHMFGKDASSHENYLTINASPVPSTALAGGICVVTDANTFTPGSTITGSNAQSGADAFFDVDGAATPGVSVGDFIIAEGCTPECLNGLWQVTARSTNKIEVAGFSTAPIDGMFKEDMPTDATATGTLYKADICVLRCNAGSWEVADGDNTAALTYTAIGVGSTSLQTAYATGSDITVSSANTSIDITGTVNDSTTLLNLLAGNHTAGTGGSLLTATDDASSTGTMVALTSNGSGTAFDVLQTGSGDLITARTSSQTIFEVDGLGEVLITPLTGTDFTATTLTTGNIDFDTASGNFTFDSTAGAFSFDAVAPSNLSLNGGTSASTVNLDLAVTNGGAGQSEVNISANNTDVTGNNSLVTIDAASTAGSGTVTVTADTTINVSNDTETVTGNLFTGNAAKTVNLITGTTAGSLTALTGAGHTGTFGDITNTLAMQVNSSTAVGLDVGGSVTIDMTPTGTNAATDWVITFPTKNVVEASALTKVSNSKNGIVNINTSNMNYGNGASEGDIYGVYGGGNQGYTSTTGTTSGTIHVLSTVAATVTNSVAFTAGVSSTSDAQIEVSSGDGANFSVGDIIIVAGSTDAENDGLYAISAIATDVLDVEGMSTALSEEFLQAQVFTNAADTSATVAQVNLTMFRTDASGNLVFRENFNVVGGTDSSLNASTLEQAYEDVGTSPAVMSASFQSQVSDGDTRDWTTTATQNLLAVSAAGGGDSVTLGFGAGAGGGDTVNVNSQTFDVTSDANSFSAGVSVDDNGGTNTIHVGANTGGGAADTIRFAGTSGTVEASAGALTLQSTLAGSKVDIVTADGATVGDVEINPGSATAATVDGAGFTVLTGQGNTSGNSGAISLGTDDANGTATSVSGTVSLVTGDNGDIAGSGSGSMSFTTGGLPLGGTAGYSGGMSFTTGSAAATGAGPTGKSGAMDFFTGSNTLGAAGGFSVTVGSSAASGEAANVGNISLSASANAGTDGSGNITFSPGLNSSSGAAGILRMIPPASTSGANGYITIDSDLAITEELLKLDNTGAAANGVDIDLFAASVTPVSNITGNPGDVTFRSNGTSSGFWIHKGSGSDSTSWEEVTTSGNNLTRTVGQVTVNTTIAAGTDVTTSNTDAVNNDLPDHSAATFATEVAVYVNGIRMLQGSGNDVIAGTTPSNGDINFPSLGLISGDVITVEVWTNQT